MKFMLKIIIFLFPDLSRYIDDTYMWILDKYDAITAKGSLHMDKYPMKSPKT